MVRWSMAKVERNVKYERQDELNCSKLRLISSITPYLSSRNSRIQVLFIHILNPLAEIEIPASFQAHSQRKSIERSF
uniref:Putative ovule protein n=1 Tax=Solanum chacoense TaxID=4108 RepID=A0A0V0GZ37_SOLCH